MIEYTLRMPPDIVIRPSGVWDSRAPLHTFLAAQREIIRTYNVLTLAVYRLTNEAEEPAIAQRSGRYWLRAHRTGVQAGRSWGNYRRTLPRKRRDILPTPVARDVALDLSQSLYPLRRDTIVRYSAVFETFAQCWALNYLLALIEGGREWSRSQRRLAEDFSPEHGTDTLPTLPRILDVFPFLQDGLSKLPAFTTSDRSDRDTPEAVTSEVNALEAVTSWRAVRNLVVHRGGMLSLRFLDRHGAFFEWLRGHYPYMLPLEVGNSFLFYDDVVRAVFAVHSRAASWMSDVLEEVSVGRRGHPLAPGPKPSEVFFPDVPPPAPPLLTDGDHAPSLQWTRNDEFRTRFRQTAPRDPRRRLTRRRS